MAIPVIDIAPLRTADHPARAETLAKLSDAHRNAGFSVLVGHGVARDVIAGLLDASRRFHDLPQEKKIGMRYRSSLRGFLPMGTSTLSKSTLGTARKPNHSESFIALPDLPETLRARWSDSPLGGTQPWPDDPADLKAAALRYREDVSAVTAALIPAFEEILALPATTLTRNFSPAHVILRLLHYPATPVREADSYGSAPHTDYGCLTLVAQDDVGGLQVRADDGEWLDVPRIDNALVLNSGQVLEAWSGGRIKATPHRVLNNGERARNSIALFYDCGIETRIECLVPTDPPFASGCLGKQYGAHLSEFLRANYSFLPEAAAS